MLAAAAVGGILLMLFGGNIGGGGEKDIELIEAEYAAELEDELLRLCSSVRGVSECEVSVTLSTGFEYIYDSRGQTVTVQYPRVCGVAVVCRGGDVPQIEKELSDLISALLGISSTQIAVSAK